jgi:hypothetical protein
MRIHLKELNYYFLTNNNPQRKEHMLEEFKEYKLIEVNPEPDLSRNKSGASGFLKMFELGLKEQEAEQIEENENNNKFKPFVIFEDDAKKYKEWSDTIEIPDDTDILYIGLSQCGMYTHGWSNNVFYSNVNEEIIKVFNMLALHGLIICSQTGVEFMQKHLNKAFKEDIPWDIDIALQQKDYNMYALRKPLVYQYGLVGGQENTTKIEFNNLENLP